MDEYQQITNTLSDYVEATCFCFLTFLDLGIPIGVISFVVGELARALGLVSGSPLLLVVGVASLLFLATYRFFVWIFRNVLQFEGEQRMTAGSSASDPAES